MASYSDPNFLELSRDKAFNKLHDPGGIPSYTGIYRCEVCGVEIVVEKNRQFPPKDHHGHSLKLGAIKWRLIVADKLDFERPIAPYCAR